MIYLRSLVALVDLAAALANVALDTLAAHVADPSADGDTEPIDAALADLAAVETYADFLYVIGGDL